jgi:uncharacterized protein (DUF342 family)
MLEANSASPSKPASGPNIEITVLREDFWKARILFPTEDISDQEMLFRLREAKQKISVEYHVPLELLEFKEVVGREETYSGVFVSVSIARMVAGKGKAALHLSPLKAPNGELFMDMLAEADFYYLDEFDQVLSLERLLEIFDKSGLSRKVLNMEAIKEAVGRVHERRSYVTKLEIARGRFPDRGTDAELEYMFHTDPGTSTDLSEYRNSRKVKEGDILCQKIPPQNGKQPGMNVRGESILPLKGFDFKLAAGEGAKLAADGNCITAARDGLAVMTRFVKNVYTTAGKKVVPSRIEITVKELVKVRSGDKKINISVEDSVEISGDLKAGSSVFSRGEIFLDGAVEKGSQLQAANDILISGQITGAQVNSESSVFGKQGAKDSVIHAQDEVSLDGVAENSEIAGRCVKILESLGSRIMASYKVQIQQAKTDAQGHRTTIRVGRGDFYASKVKASKEAIETMTTSLQRIQEFFGKDTVERLDQENTQKLLLDQMQQLKNKGQKQLSHEQVQSLKKLLDAIKPLQTILAENEEVEVLQRKATEKDADRPVVIIRETMTDPVDVTLEDKTLTIPPTEGGVHVTLSDEGEMVTTAYHPDLEEPEDEEEAS